MNTPSPVNHIFVDFENVHDVALSLIGQKSFHVTVLIGAKQTKLDAALIEKLLQHTDSAHLVRLRESERNAMDFALAYYVGRAAVLHPLGFFHIISKDTGYDPLIAHLRRNQVRIHRHKDFEALKETLRDGKSSESTLGKPLESSSIPVSSLPAVKGPVDKNKTPAPNEQVARAFDHLQSHPKNRPAKDATLARHLMSLFGQTISEANAKQVIEALRVSNKLSINEKGRIMYHL